MQNANAESVGRISANDDRVLCVCWSADCDHRLYFIILCNIAVPYGSTL